MENARQPNRQPIVTCGAAADLLLIGLARARCCCGSSDILVGYALLLAAVAGLRRGADAHALAAGVGAGGVICSPSAWVLLFGAIGTLAQHDASFQQQIAEVGRQWQHALEAQRQAFGAGTFAQATAQRVADLGESLRSLLVNGPTLLGMFLLDAWFVRSGVIAAPERHGRLFALLRWGALPLGIALMCREATGFRRGWTRRGWISLSLAWALASLANLLMCLGCHLASGDALVPRWPGWRRPDAWRSATTCRSLVCTLLFYGYGAVAVPSACRAWR